MTASNSERLSDSRDTESLAIDLGRFAPYLVSRLHTHFQNVLLEALEPHGLLVADWRALLCLSRREQAYIGDVVQFTSLPQATVSRSIKRLRDKGLLLRKLDKDDRRASLVRISQSGRELLRQLIGELGPTAEADLRLLVGNDSEAFLQLLREAVRNARLETVHDLLDNP